MVKPWRSTGVMFTASGRSTRPLTTYSRKACIKPAPHSGCRRRCFGGLADKTGHRVARLRALADPVLRPFVIEREIITLLPRLIGADFFDELAVARTAIVRHHNAEHGVVGRPDSLHAYSHCHKIRNSQSEWPKITLWPRARSGAGSKRGVRLFMPWGVGKPCFRQSGAFSYRYGWCNSTFAACFERSRMFRLSTPTENAIAK